MFSVVFRPIINVYRIYIGSAAAEGRGLKLTKSQRRKAIQYLYESHICKGRKHAQIFFNGLGDKGQDSVYLDSIEYYKAGTTVKVTGKNLGEAFDRAESITGHRPVPSEGPSGQSKSKEISDRSPPSRRHTTAVSKPLKRPFLVHLTLGQIEQLKLLSERTGESQAFHIRAAIERYLRREHD